MANFFKTFLKGILYVVTFPLLIVGLAIYFVFSLFSFIFLSIKGLILFFKGESIVGDLKEDIEAKKRMEILMDPIGALQKQEPPVTKEVVSNVVIEQHEENKYPELTNTIESSTIEKQPDVQEKTINILEPGEEPEHEDDIIQDKLIDDDINKHIEEISIESTKDNNHTPYNDEPYDEDDEEDSGVTIEGYDEDDE